MWIDMAAPLVLPAGCRAQPDKFSTRHAKKRARILRKLQSADLADILALRCSSRNKAGKAVRKAAKSKQKSCQDPIVDRLAVECCRDPFIRHFDTRRFAHAHGFELNLTRETKRLALKENGTV